MNELSDRIEQEYEKLKTRRDELRVQLNLGRKEVEDAWDEGELKWHELEAKLKLARKISNDTASDVVDVTRKGASATLADAKETSEKLMEELREGYERLRKLI